MTGRATMTGNATMTGRATGCLKKSGPRKIGFWPFSLAGWFYMDRKNAVWSGHIVAPLWIPHLPIFGKKLTPGPLGPKKGPKRRVWALLRDQSELINISQQLTFGVSWDGSFSWNDFFDDMSVGIFLVNIYLQSIHFPQRGELRRIYQLKFFFDDMSIFWSTYIYGINQN